MAERRQYTAAVMADLPGIYSMSVTPFRADGSLDEDALRSHLRYQAAAGAGIYLGSYGSGEGHLLREREIERIYEIAVEELKGKVPLYAAALGFTETDYVIHQAQRAAAIGVDAVQIHPPRPGTPVHRPTPPELERFYDDVLNSVATPVHLSNQTVMVGGEVPVAFFAKLVETYGHIQMINNTSQDLSYLVRLLDALDDKVLVSVGMVTQLTTVLELGGHGSLCFEPNVAPRLTMSVVEAYRSGDHALALDRFAHLMRLNEILMKYQNPRSLKAALRVLGLPGGYLRRPYLDLDEAAHEDIRATLNHLGIREIEGLS